MEFHIRQRLAKRGGNNFYRDRSERASATFCGAPCTQFDAVWADRKRSKDWQNEQGDTMTVCLKCKAQVVN